MEQFLSVETGFPQLTMGYQQKECEIVWEYISPVTQGEGSRTWIEDAPFPPVGPKASFSNNIFRVNRYAADYPGLAGKDLTPKDQIAPDPKSGWRPRVDLTGATQPGVELWKRDWDLDQI